MARAGWLVTLVLALPPLLGLVFAATQAPEDPYGMGTGVRWDRAFAATGRSLALAVVVLLGSVSLGTFLGWGQARWAGRGLRGISLVASLPLVVPSYVMAAALGRAWGDLTGSPPEGLLPAAVVLVLATTPLVQLTVATALSRTSASEEEAARCLGASDAQILQAVVWPRLRPALALSGLLVALYAISDFGVVAMLDVPVLTWRMYDAVARQQLARAALLGALAFASVMPLAALAWWVRGGAMAQGVANVRPAPRRAPSPLQRGAFVVVGGLVAGLGALLPVGVLVGWVADGVERGLPFASTVGPSIDTLGIAVLGALAITALATVPALVRGQRALEGVVYATSVLPAVLVAFGWLGAALGLARLAGGRSLYQLLLGSGLVLALAYAARFLAEVHGPVKASALRLDPRQDDAVACLGASRWAWFRHVAAPGLWPGVRTGLLLGALVLAKELPITLLLGTPAGLQPLAFRLWDRHSEALWHDAGLAGLLLVVFATVGRLGLAWSESRRMELAS